MNNMLSLQGVKKSYNLGKPNQIDVLRDVNLSIAPGEVVGLIAPSGEGKSTLLHISGLLDLPDQGAIHIAGQDLSGKGDGIRTAMRRAGVGFIYQFHHLLPEFSALDNVVLPQLANAVPERDAKARAMDLLTKVGLKDRASHRPAALSGGEQQRVAFCRALANRPALLLADEPTGNLDSDTSDLVFDVLMGLVRQEGLSALIATHSKDLAAKMDRVVRLKAGEILPV